MSVCRQIAVSASLGERIAVIGLFFSLLPCKLLIAFLLGGVLFLVYRQEKRYLAYSSLLAALWQLSFHVINGLLYTPLRSIAASTKNITDAFLFQPWQWGHLTMAGQLTMTILLTSFVMNFGIAGWGMILTLYGRVVRLPLLSHICERMLPATSA